MTLFDEIERTTKEPALYDENAYNYYNRSARLEFNSARALLEKWFAKYPASFQRELKSAFISDFEPAFFELFLHEFLLQHGFHIELHPDVPNSSKHPDFLVHTHRGNFYLEATVASDTSDQDREKYLQRNKLYDQINKINSPNFFFFIKNIEIIPKKNPRIKPLIEFIKAELTKLNPEYLRARYESTGLDQLPTLSFKNGMLSLDIVPIPKSAQMRGRSDSNPIGIHSVKVEVSTLTETLKESIHKKATRYGKLDLPYILAINSIRAGGVNDEDMMTVLFGTEQIHFNPQTGKEVGMSRKNNGAFVGPSGFKNTRVSGVMIGSIFPTHLNNALSLYCHPAARRPLNIGILNVTHAIVVHDELKTIIGAPLRKVLKLSDQWPN